MADERLKEARRSGGVPRTAVLVDHHPLWLGAVERVLDALGIAVVATATTLAGGREAAEAAQPDVVVAEIAGHDGAEPDGIGWLRELRRRLPETRFVVLSADCGPGLVGDALAAGASAHVSKSAQPEDLATAVRQAFAQTIYLRQAAVPVPEPGGPDAERASALTRRELEILRLAAEGLSNADLATELWVTEQTVKFHLSNIYRKLGVSNRTEAGRWAQLAGLLRPRADAGEASET